MYVDMSVGNPNSHDPIPLQSLKEFSKTIFDASMAETRGKYNLNENPIYGTESAGQEKIIKNPMYDSENPEKKSVTSLDSQSERISENIYDTIPGQN